MSLPIQRRPLKPGETSSGTAPDSMGPTLVTFFFFFFRVLLIYLFGCWVLVEARRIFDPCSIQDL